MKLIFILLATILIAGCKVDNYPGPSLTFAGKIVDNETGEAVQSGGINAGTVVKLYEGSSTQPLLLATRPDGTFTNAAMFPGTYTYTAEGPFTPVSSTPETLTMNNNSEIEIKVVPNVRMKMSLVSSAGNSAVVKIDYEKVNTAQDLTTVGVVWSKYPNPNSLTFSGGDLLLTDVAPTDPSTGTMNLDLNSLTSHSTYYIRAIGRTNNPGGYFNYSEQYQLDIP